MDLDKHWYWLGGFIIAGILLGAGVIYLVSRPPRGNPIILLPVPSQAPITVYVTGMVSEPGLYSLPSGSRINDALQAAGGFSSGANTGAINLAEVLMDGQKIDIPSQAAQQMNANPDGTIIGIAQVNINTANLQQLDSLPGIGPAFSQEIIDYRNANGPFTKVEDIMDVPGIGQGKYDAIKELITVGTSP